jgi:pimeloyl-ACP methyl ester carboxylesterase
MQNSIISRIHSFFFPTYPNHTHLYHPQKTSIIGKKINFVKVGNGPPIIFIHGWTNDWEGWIPVIPYLQSKFSVYLVDLPGFGHSDDLLNHNVEAAAKYLSLFIKKEIKKKTTVVGVSMGSFVATDMGIQSPQIIDKVILTGPVINNDGHHLFAKFFHIFLILMNTNSITQTVIKRIVETRAAAYFFGKYLNMYRFQKDIVDEYGMVGKQLVRKKVYLEMGISATNYDLKTRLKEIRVPTLLIVGDRDRYADIKHIKSKVLPINKLLKMKIIKDAGHVTPWEETEDVCRLITTFK